MRSSWIALIGMISIGVVTTLLSSCGGQENTLVIAYANEEPYGYLDTATGEVTGEAPEIAKVIAERLGYDGVEAKVVKWDSLIPGLKAGRYDVVAAGMYITPERAANVAFSRPTYRIGDAFLVKKGNPKDLHSYADVKDNPDATIGVVQGTVERDYARKSGIPDDRVVLFNDNDSAVAGVRSGQVDVFAGTALTVQTIVNKLGEEAVVERAEPFTNPVIDGKEVWGYGAFAFHPENTDLRDAFNTELEQFLGSEAHLTLVKPFGFTAKEIPEGMTAEDVLEEKE